MKRPKGSLRPLGDRWRVGGVGSRSVALKEDAMRLTVASDAARAGGSQRLVGSPFIFLLAGLCAALSSRSASAAPFNTGDGFASVGDGLGRHFHASGLP